MFIKIVRCKQKDIPYREQMFECEAYNFVQTTSDSKIKLLSLDQHLKRHLTIEIDPNREEIYVLNNDGKTIDSYIWSKDEDLASKSKN